jgi:hypothetical protein
LYVKYGFDPANKDLQNLLSLASQVQEMMYHNHVVSIELIKLHLSFIPDSLTNDEEKLFVAQLMNSVIAKIRFQPLKTRLLELAAASSMNKELFSELDKILLADKQLDALSAIQLAQHRLSKTEIESLFPKSPFTLEQATEQTVHQAYLVLLSKAYPHSKGMFDIVRNETPAEINSALEEPELLYSIIAAEVLNRTKSRDELTHEAAKQLLEALGKKLNKPQAIEPNLSLIQLHLFIQSHIEQVEKGIEKRTLIMDALGFAVPTFKNIEEVMNELASNSPQDHAEIMQKFYSSIKLAKEQFLYRQLSVEEPQSNCAAEMAKEAYLVPQQPPNKLKLIEELSEKDIVPFFKACCAAGRVAAKELQNTRSVSAVIADVLKMFLNWAICKLSFGNTPTFFKPETTPVASLAAAVSELKGTLEETLDHIDLDITLGEGYSL